MLVVRYTHSLTIVIFAKQNDLRYFVPFREIPTANPGSSAVNTLFNCHYFHSEYFSAYIGVERVCVWGGGTRHPNNFGGGPTYPLDPPIIHPHFPSVPM